MPFIRKRSAITAGAVTSVDTDKPTEGKRIQIKRIGMRLLAANSFAKYNISLLDEDRVTGLPLDKGKWGTHLFEYADFTDRIEEWPDEWQLRVGITANASSFIYVTIEWDFI